VTPTDYLEMLKSYSFILARTRSIIGKQRDKLQNGLSKLEDARIQVEEMNTMSEVKRIDVQKKTKGAEELVLGRSLRNRGTPMSDLKSSSLNRQSSKRILRTERLGRADEELAKAMPALEAANNALEQLQKKEIAEIKAYASPPPDCRQGYWRQSWFVCKEGTSWAEAKKVLADPNFMNRLVDFDKDNITSEHARKNGEVYFSG